MVNVLGFNFDGIGILLIFIAIATIIAIIGFFFIFYFSKMHPKKGFKIHSRTGVHTRQYRLKDGKIPTELDIFSILLGKKQPGFPITWFKQNYYDGKQFYEAQYIEGRIMPLPLSDMLGTATVLLKKCKDCSESSRYWEENIDKCPKCGGAIIFETETISNVTLQAIKFNPDVEVRAMYKVEIDNDKKLPLSEYVAMFDVGAKIAEAMSESTEETQGILNQNNPFVTAIIAALPLAVLMIGFGFAAYIMWTGMGNAISTAGTTLQTSTSNNLLAAQILQNITGGKPL